MGIVAEVFYYLLDQFEKVLYRIEEWRREASTIDKYFTIVIVGFILGILFLGGCSLPQGTRKVTAWGVGVLPTTSGIPLPFAGYWHSEHGEDVISEQSAQPALPTSVPVPTTTPSGLDEWMCVLDKDANVLHCGSYEAWERWQAEQMKKNGF